MNRVREGGLCGRRRLPPRHSGHNGGYDLRPVDRCLPLHLPPTIVIVPPRAARQCQRKEQARTCAPRALMPTIHVHAERGGGSSFQGWCSGSAACAGRANLQLRPLLRRTPTNCVGDDPATIQQPARSSAIHPSAVAGQSTAHGLRLLLLQLPPALPARAPEGHITDTIVPGELYPHQRWS